MESHYPRKLYLTLLIAIIALCAVAVVIGTGFSTGQASHATLFTDTIRGKTSGSVFVQDALQVNGRGFVTSGAPGDIFQISQDANRFLRMGIDNVGLYLDQNSPTLSENMIRVQARAGAGGPVSSVHVDGANQQVRLNAPTEVLRVDNRGFTSLQTVSQVFGGAALCFEGVSTAGRATISQCQASSRRFKDNIQNLNVGMDEIQKLRPVSFTWKGRDETNMGFIAEEVEAVDPRLIIYYNNTINGVKYDQITALLTKAIQEQQQEIDDLKAQIQELNARLG